MTKKSKTSLFSTFTSSAVLLALAFSFLAISFFSKPLYAQEVLDLTRQGQVKTDDASSAKQQIMDQVIEAISLESVKAIIGDEKTGRTIDQIKNKVIKNSGKYILSSRGENFVKKSDQYVMDVQVKLSLKNLRALLLEQGLLYQMEGPPKVLPIVQVVDRIGARSYGWWYPTSNKDHAFLSEQSEQFHKALREELQKIGFYTMAPITSHFSNSVPEAFRSENLPRADSLFLGEYFKSSIVTRGQILFRPKADTENVFLIDVRLEALHTGNGRLMAEVTRTYETDPGQFRPVISKKFIEVAPKLAEDLSAQLTEAWKKGTFGASVMLLSVVGKITPKALDEFKKNVVLQVRDIKALRERMIEARKTTFEIDSSVLPQQLAQSFKAAKFAGLKVIVEDVTSQQLTIRLDPL